MPPKPMTHNEYLRRLRDKNILVEPLQQYVNARTKILHKCTCGNIWDAIPGKILKGSKCLKCKVNPNPKWDNKRYLSELKIKDIKVIPLEKYINALTPISHKCTCGKIWNVLPSKILRGFHCGCKSTPVHNKKYYKDKKTILYFIKINDFYKIGVTLFRSNNIEDTIIKNRFGSYNKKFKIGIIDYRIFEDGAEAFQKEQEILSKYKDYKYLNETIKFGGHTELLGINIIKRGEIL